MNQIILNIVSLNKILVFCSSQIEGNHIIISEIELISILNIAKHLEKLGFVKKIKNCIGTTQSTPFDKIYNFQQLYILSN